MLNISYKYDIIFTSFSSLVGVQSLSSAQRQQLHITVTKKGNRIIDFECFAKEKNAKMLLDEVTIFWSTPPWEYKNNYTRNKRKKVVKKISQKLPVKKYEENVARSSGRQCEAMTKMLR
jgi:hypothetical protein